MRKQSSVLTPTQTQTPALILQLVLALAFTCMLNACADLSPQARDAHADKLAATKQWRRVLIPTKVFTLAAYVPPTPSTANTLAIYIEGDGFAWRTPYRPSDNPTPRDPIGLALAMRHASGVAPSVAAGATADVTTNVAADVAIYLARPCQYVVAAHARGCAVSYWTNKRFAPEVISATDQAIDHLKARFHAQHLMLIGYSGGGAVAALVAARRKDVTALVTVAGNLDHVAWTTLHHVHPLDGSLNPADAWQHLINVPQVHFVGAHDKNISIVVSNAYVDRFPLTQRPLVQLVADADHACCWAYHWPALLNQHMPIPH